MIADAAAQWRRDGWAMVDGLLPAGLVAEALAELKAVEPERLVAAGGPARRAEQVDDWPRFRGRQFDGTTLFPYPAAPTLNRLFVHPNLVDFAAATLGTDDLRIYQSRVWSKYGDHTDYEQPHHLDRNHSLVPVREGAGWGHLELFVYLHDVDQGNGAPKVVPASVAPPLEVGGAGGLGAQLPQDAPHFYESEVSAVGSAGSALAYRSDVWHRGVDIPEGAERHILVVAFRPAHVEWIGFDAHAPLVNSPDFVAFAEQCTPDELALFGVPRPGHGFWTAAVLERMAGIYPELDLSPWWHGLGAAG